jgi:hypothetical protein
MTTIIHAKHRKKSFFSLSQTVDEPSIPTVTATRPEYHDIDSFRAKTLESIMIKRLRTSSFFDQIEKVFQLSGIAAMIHKNRPSKASYKAGELSLGWRLRDDELIVMKVTQGDVEPPSLPEDDYIVDDKGYEVGRGVGNVTYHRYELAGSYDDSVFNKSFNLDATLDIVNPVLPDWFVQPLEQLQKQL